MAAKDLGPLDWKAPIVDTQGRPSPEFQRRWNLQRTNNGLIGAVTTGSGAPTGTPSDGAEYVDISTTPFTVYIGSGGSWHTAGVVVFTDLADAPHSYAGKNLALVRVKSTVDGVEFVTQSAQLDTLGTPAIGGLLERGASTWGIVTISTVLDGISNTRGSVLYRGAAVWSALAPGTSGKVLTTAGAGADPTWATAGGGGGGPATSPAIRASNIQSSSAATYTVAWPAGTVTNDVVLIFFGGGFGVTTPPTGWIFLHSGIGSNYNGCCMAKQMTAGDIAAGSVVVTPGGTFNSTVSAITINGATWGSLSAVTGQQSAGGTLSSSLTALGVFWPTSLALYWGATRAASNVTVVAGGSAVQQALNAANSSGALYAGIPPSAIFGVAGTFNYSVSGSGFYDVIVLVTGV